MLRLYRFRELLGVLIYRDLRGHTRASLLGYGWIVLQPLLATGIFTLLIQGVLKIHPSGDTPYPVFIFVGMTLWNYFSAGLSAATSSMVEHADLLRQVSFPREILVFYPLISKMVDFVISIGVLAMVCFLYHIPLNPFILLTPLFLIPVLLVLY